MSAPHFGIVPFRHFVPLPFVPIPPETIVEIHLLAGKEGTGLEMSREMHIAQVAPAFGAGGEEAAESFLVHIPLGEGEIEGSFPFDQLQAERDCRFLHLFEEGLYLDPLFGGEMDFVRHFK